MKKYLHIHIWWIFQPTIVEYPTYLLGQVSVFWWNLGSMVLMYSGLIASPMILGFPYKTSAMFPKCHRLWHQTRLKTVHTWILAGILCSSTSFLDNLNSFPLNCNWTRTNIPKHTNAQNRLSVPWQNRKDLSAFAMAIKLSQRVNHVVVRYLHLSCIRTMAMILQPAKHPPILKSAATTRGLKKNSPRSLSPTSPKNHAWILLKNPHNHPCSPGAPQLSIALPEKALKTTVSTLGGSLDVIESSKKTPHCGFRTRQSTTNRSPTLTTNFCMDEKTSQPFWKTQQLLVFWIDISSVCKVGPCYFTSCNPCEWS